MLKKERTCIDCPFWCPFWDEVNTKTAVTSKDGNEGIVHLKNGLCRANPPTIGGFPITWEIDWCSIIRPEITIPKV